MIHLIRRYSSTGRTLGLVSAIAVLAACENMPEMMKTKNAATETTAAQSGTLKLEERDVEVPEIFNVTENAVWDGRPSFGGVWVAYPSNTQPERVNIRNVDNGKTVVGALFKREEDNPGPKIRLSSDAAEALGVVAGEPTKLTITALRREPVEVAEPGQFVDTGVVTQTILDPVEVSPVAASAAEAIESAVEPEPTVQAVAQAPQATAVAAAPEPATTLAKPFVQVGTFSSQSNADALVSKLTANGVLAQLRTSQQSSGKSLYRVLAGPATTAAELASIQTSVANLGFKDTFPVAK